MISGREKLAAGCPGKAEYASAEQQQAGGLGDSGRNVGDRKSYGVGLKAVLTPTLVKKDAGKPLNESAPPAATLMMREESEPAMSNETVEQACAAWTLQVVGVNVVVVRICVGVV